ncbi:Inactive tyrosine-protein kinase RYK [Caenorhabditis elegans]|uniref:Inactive tyrosine-protein kinase RYK n=1 Tax=Caenorhabditis elegans TaxID=6239 RepID=RYK_CAEEL|nr:Inactive tyrosine-protein kinase RYK [Caenorhabditis elegans]G5EGT9.1 RecName: Full=Inactive tyrosine-protein kinase RYK; AltName: Full=Abnormal cell lineage protein 18; Flags: Precursor [Caenorhabditis elegans]AAD24877.1 tyrosine kinase receptor-related protein precursor RYK [Caenorhabditis elegans]CCD64652.1 Inactive tyrosine-protein kinase RYK [Caenorhabditis elegans]|eukprot:NP_508684.4 Inactive tyrosine-protein kinase RYK [Caenorhabditis elegans]
MILRYLIFFAQLWALCLANVNMFISKEEMNRTFGVKAELNYIEMGNVSSYSTKFHYRVMANIDYLSFTWNAVGIVHYEVYVESDDSSVLPIVRIPLKGTVPESLQDFTVEYRCAGHRSGQFAVSLYFTFKYGNKEPLKVKLRQEKICASRDGRRGLNGGYEGHEVDDTDSIDKAFFVIICIAAAFLLIVAATLICYFKRSKKEDMIPTRLPTSFRNSLKSTKSAQPFLLSTPRDGPPTLSAISSAPCSSSSASGNSIIPSKPRNIDVRRALLQLYQDRDAFQSLPLDMEGTFGEVRYAIWRQVDDVLNGDVDDEEDTFCNQEAVYTKTLKNNASPIQLDRFLSDALLFYNITPHQNLSQVACVASFGRFDRPETVTDFPLVCYRHQGFGNLKKFLTICRHGDKTKGAQTLRTHQLVSLATQVSSAVAHIHKYRIVHNDIAARNCLIAEVNGRLQVQLCDSALSRDLFPADYHCLGDNENRPLKWMSPEAIANELYSSAADVWSLGVLLWELMSLGGSPHAEIDPEEVYTMILKGKRLQQPNNCPDQLYEVMLCCWRVLSEDRPSSEQVVHGLRDFNIQLSQYI